MSEHAAGTHANGEGHEGGHDTKYYVKIWAVLLVLLVISVAGPFVGIKLVTLVTAFGIALVKAFLVAKNFMHLDVQKPFVRYLLGACLAAMLMFFGGVAADVMKHDGQNWSNVAAKKVVEEGLAENAREAEHPGTEHHAEP